MKEVYDTNLLGTTLACQAYLKKNIRQRLKGSIINIASSAATRSGPGMVTYAASKAGVLGLTRSLGAEYSRSGFRVNAISPGFIDTDMTQGMDQSV
jgi:3-oxoacyl-[acyl-carrier protein] reductase